MFTEDETIKSLANIIMIEMTMTATINASPLCSRGAGSSDCGDTGNSHNVLGKHFAINSSIKTTEPY
jgi:hypothetical protein